MKTTLALVALAVLAFCAVVSADASVPTVTNVYFQKEGKPYTAPVDYTVNCYGYERWPQDPAKQPGTYTPEVVFTYTASCPEYGCKIYNPYYLNYRVIDYCNLEGTAGGTVFKISNWSDSPRPDDCERAQLPYSIIDDGGYYQSTPEYENCTTIAYAISCDQYRYEVPQDQVDTVGCDMSSSTDSGAHCYKETPEWRNCVAEKDTEVAKCKKYLHKLTDGELAQIEKDDRGNDIMYKCQLTIALPSSNQPITPLPQPEPPAPKVTGTDNTMLIAAVVILALAVVGLAFLKMKAKKPKK